MTWKWLPLVTIAGLQSQSSFTLNTVFYVLQCCGLCPWLDFFHITEVIEQQGAGREK